MGVVRLIAALLVLAASALARPVPGVAGEALGRLPHSPFPTPRSGLNASRALFALDTAGFATADALLASTLQGAVNRDAPAVYRAPDVLDTSAPYGRWLSLTASLFGIAVNTSFVRDLPGLLGVFASQGRVDAYVLADAASVNTAVAACAALPGTVAVFVDNEAVAVGAGLRFAWDVRGRDTAWAIATFNGTSASGNFTYSTRVTVVQDPSKTPAFMADYAVATGALVWWDTDMGSELARSVLSSMAPGFAALGWGPDEKGTVAAVSAAGGAVVPADWAINLDVLSAWDLPALPPQRAPADPAPPVPAPQQHTVTFLMSDGDNVQFLLNDFGTGASFWGSPDRGAAALGWTIAPGLTELAPAAMQWLYETATPAGAANRTANTDGRDLFVAGVSGTGYFFPDVMSASADGDAMLAELAVSTAEFMAKTGLRLLNVLAEGNGLPPAGVAEALLAADGIDALFWYPYDNYSGLRGSVTWPVAGKPVIGGAFNLWGDGSDCGSFCNNNQTVARLLAAPRNPALAASYSLIPVHAWTHSVGDVAWITAALEAAEPGAVAVVAPDEFVRRLVANVRQA